MRTRELIAALLISLVGTMALAWEYNFCFNGGGGTCKDLKPVAAIAPPFKAFGNVSTTVTHSATFTLSNTGNAAMTNVSVGVTGDGFSNHSSTCGSTLAKNGTCSWKTHFTPAAAQAYTGAVSVSSNQLADFTASLSGTGTATDPYTTLFASDWAGTGEQDTSNPSGGVYSGWTSETDANSIGASTGGKYVVTKSANAFTSYVIKSGLTAKNEIELIADVYMSSVTQTGANGNRVMEVKTSNNNGVSLYISSSGTTINRVFIQYQNGGNTVSTVSTTSYSFSADTKYTIALKFKESSNTSTSDGYYSVDINGASVIAQTAVATAQTNLLSIVRVGLIAQDSAQTQTWSFDNVIYRWK